MGRRNNLLPMLLVIVFLVAVFVFYPGAGVDITTEYITLLPSLILIVISIYGVKGSRGHNQVFACALLGIGFALLADQLNTLNVLIPDILTPTLTLQYFQALIIAFSAIIGVAMNK